ncbi:Protein-arginine kinase activator protein McsA [Clostridium cavendishii DSM 21758]|uniref:Protein-arginine kinase activator protein McsA n=1 Tax=Clostridium cavendishii DSM 21758 TaxID=1121302 RepID=A0A1M6V0X3_9CLOT|nr:UvrB/UvrC motif-containing protein [Clostridium cavendishii]SHK75139.1 Protein-arginine kinase activator protein McsA [Clostridium cavendishii DSM 21758]
MLCEKCNVNEATVHIVKVTSGNKEEMRLCEKCASEISEIPFNTEIKNMDNFTFQSLLSGLVDYISNNPKNKSVEEKVCERCKMTYSDFKKTGLLGCSSCYSSFSNTIKPVIKRVQGDLEHVGKIPKKAGKEIIEKKRLLKLKEELQVAILAEEYEKAAILRDEIKAFRENINE